MTTKFLSLGIALASIAVASPSFAQAPPLKKIPKDIVRRTYVVRGKFIAFEVGDYVHAVVKDSHGKENSYYFGTTGLDYYLANFVNRPGVFTIQVADSYIPEAGGRTRIESMMRAKIGTQDSKAWWRAQVRKSSLEKLEKKYQPMVDKLTRK